MTPTTCQTGDDFPGVATAVFPTEPERAVDNNALLERKLADASRAGHRETIAALPQGQRAVITLRDMIGCSPEQTCDALGLTDANERVLHHRARTKIRAALETAFATLEISA